MSDGILSVGSRTRFLYHKWTDRCLPSPRLSFLRAIVRQNVIESGDFLIAINGQKLSGNNFSFEDAISRCSRASMPR